MRLIDADAIPYEEHYVPDGDIQWEYKKELCVLKPAIDDMPTVDAVEVVRCKDCIHCSTNTPDGLHWCSENEIGSLCDDDYCSFGKRREDE